MKLLTVLFLLITLVSAQEKYTADKTVCIQQSEHSAKTLGQLKEILVNQAKQEALAELYGQLMYSKTDLKDGKIMSDEIRQRAIGVVRTLGNPKFYNGSNFGSICVDTKFYTTKKDLEKYSPKKVSLTNYCFNNPNVALNKVKYEAKHGAYKEIISQYNPSLVLSNKQAEQYIHGFKVSNDTFDFDTASYCFDAVGTILPYELDIEQSSKKITSNLSSKCGEILNINNGEYITYALSGDNAESLKIIKEAHNHKKTYSLASVGKWTKNISNTVDFSKVNTIKVYSSKMSQDNDRTDTKIELLNENCKALLTISFDNIIKYKDVKNTVNIYTKDKLFYKHKSKSNAKYNGRLDGTFTFTKDQLIYKPRASSCYFNGFNLEASLLDIKFSNVKFLRVTSKAQGNNSAISSVKLLK